MILPGVTPNPAVASLLAPGTRIDEDQCREELDCEMQNVETFDMLPIAVSDG